MKYSKYLLLAVVTVTVLVGARYVLLANEDNKTVKTYLNNRYNYSFEYPVSYDQADTKDPDYISMHGPGGGLSLRVETTTLKDARAWAKAYEPLQRFEKEVTVAGYIAVTTHVITETGDDPDTKFTAFVKEGQLFTIMSNAAAHDGILASFRFTR